MGTTSTLSGQIQSYPQIEPSKTELGPEATGREPLVSLLDLEPYQCKWPVELLSWCGRPQVKGSCYCEEHDHRSRRATPSQHGPIPANQLGKRVGKLGQVKIISGLEELPGWESLL